MKEADKKVEVVVHRMDWVTKAGYRCLAWSGYRVAVGPNPCGPRGGRCGNVVDGKWVTRQLSSRQKAEEIAAQIGKDLE